MSNTAPRVASTTRRSFLARTAIGGSAGFFVDWSGRTTAMANSQRLRIAAAGGTGRGGDNIRGFAEVIDLVAIADVDATLLAKAAAAHPNARTYADARVMLEKEAERIDAVCVSTPDHTHAPLAAMALRLGKPVYCEKPLTHTVLEARTLAALAAERGLVTQMGTQIHAGDNYRRVVEWIRSGAIGEVREVHVWSSARYSGGRFASGEKPAGLGWNLCLGPAPEFPYSPDVHPFQWRKFWDFGSGALGDFGCHYMDLVHWALDLRSPERIEAEGPPVDAVSPPEWCIVHYDYPARGDRPPVKLHWYDSGRQPAMLGEVLRSIPTTDGKPIEWKSGQLFLGSEGMLIADYGRHRLLPVERFADVKPPEKSIPSSVGHHREFVEAIVAGRDAGGRAAATTCSFDYSGRLTEAVLLGVASYRSGRPIEWDGDAARVKGSSGESFIHKDYRKGWAL